MKVNDVPVINIKNNYDGEYTNKKSSDLASTSFSEHLLKHKIEDCQQHLISMFEKIKEQGEKLSGNINIKELNKYKKLISDYLKDVVYYSFKYNKNNTFTKRGKHKLLATVNKINDKVDALIKKILDEEKGHIDILKQIDEIKGLLLDIMI